MSLSGKVLVMTGATSGLGVPGALAFAKEGARLIIIARSQELGTRCFMNPWHDVNMAQDKSSLTTSRREQQHPKQPRPNTRSSSPISQVSPTFSVQSAISVPPNLSSIIS